MQLGQHSARRNNVLLGDGDSFYVIVQVGMDNWADWKINDSAKGVTSICHYQIRLRLVMVSSFHDSPLWRCSSLGSDFFTSYHDMSQRRSLDDTCDIFLSRRRVRSPLTNQRAASEFPHCAPMLCAESIGIAPYFLLPRPLELPELSGTALTSASTKPLPLPGSSGAVQPKAARLANGHHHVPRPRNPFILFRCDLVHQRKVLPRSDLDDTNISRIAGDLWREMTAAQKKPWVELAAQEKARHALLYPDYKYAPGHSGSKSKKANAYLEDRPPRQVSRMGPALPSDRPKPRRQAERPRPYPQCIPRRRSSSCPPVGAVPVPSHSPLEAWAPTRVTQDDMQRRPSRTVMYQSVAPQSVVEPTAPILAGYNPLLPLQAFDWLSLPQMDPSLLDPTYTLPDLSQNSESYAASNFDFFDYKPTFSVGAGNPEFTVHELKEMERLTIGTSFTDPFTTLASTPLDYDSPHAFPTAIPPFDCSGYSPGSPSPSSGTLSSN
ncbi:hypothetical protein J3R83DRAFT_9069 [Lanmaoa asiatica]|nr:hypothetical protein J3R83DRAFT_9069 [Lanmaoa asiatica]